MLKYLAMRYYRITLELDNGKSYKSVRFISIHNPDTAYAIVANKVETHFRNLRIRNLEVVMLPKRSLEVKLFMQRKDKDKYKNL